MINIGNLVGVFSKDLQPTPFAKLCLYASSAVGNSTGREKGCARQLLTAYQGYSPKTRERSRHPGHSHTNVLTTDFLKRGE